MSELQGEVDTILSYPKKQSRKSSNIIVKGSIPSERETLLNWHGWGYKDSKFIEKDGALLFSGNRYAICNVELPHFKLWLKNKFGVDVPADFNVFNEAIPREDQLPKSRMTDQQLTAFKRLNLKLSTRGIDRLIHSHGQNLFELHRVRSNTMKRIVDAIIWPNCHEDVVEIIRICDKLNVVIIPFGGGTSITGSITCPEIEPRTILSLDTNLMNEIMWVDKENMMICCETGIVGQDLERELQKLGFTLGHEPDSIEFSTLGGWLSTKASGMKKNKYGNIENLIINAKLVTPRGVLERGNCVPRFSSGNDINSIILGSEGCYGVITEAVIKIFPNPPCKRYGSLIFPDFESGFKFTRKVAYLRCQPASIRLMDNGQFEMGRNLQMSKSILNQAVDYCKNIYLTTIRGFDVNKVTMVTLVFEGEKDEVSHQEKRIMDIAREFNGMSCGETIGKRGYNMTFAIAYTRDTATDFNIMSEAMETAAPWDKAMQVIEAVKSRVNSESLKYGVKDHYVMYRIAQTYDTGCVVYFYFMFNGRSVKDPLGVMEIFEGVIRDEVVANGGCLSHHHGVGKLRRKWYKDEVSPVGVNIFRVCKKYLDPNNIFAIQNITDCLMVEQSKL